ncbi:MAG: integration host factor subunit beta [Burkholderiales bacterium]|nr:integration host factor subunit beta [Burkholderiales bacterium]
MTRSELVATLAARFPQLTALDAALALDVILTTMSDAMARGQRIEIRGFGSFTVRTRPARVGRNPRTGESLEVPEKRLPYFKAAKALRLDNDG